MKERWKILSDRQLLFVVLAFALLCVSIYNARQYAHATSRERTTTAYNVQINFSRQVHLLTPDYYIYRCVYSFDVDGASYTGRVKCPQLIDDSIKSQSHGYDGSLPIPNRTVYYDSADPSMNDLLEFGAVSNSYYRDAAVILGAGVVVISFVTWAVVITGNERRRSHGVFVDPRGTVIYPDIDYSLGSDGLFNGDRHAEKSYAAGDGAPRYVANSDPAHELRDLYLEVVKQIHPDRALNEVDGVLRERLMKEANVAFKQTDATRLRSLLEEYTRTISAF